MQSVPIKDMGKRQYNSHLGKMAYGWSNLEAYYYQ